ncbi:MAG: hypothetical protein ACYC7E_13815 [Armatimonadota bacterium]
MPSCRRRPAGAAVAAPTDSLWKYFAGATGWPGKTSGLQVGCLPGTRHRAVFTAW